MSKKNKKECFYPHSFQDKSEVVRWFYSRNNGCTVFFACSKDVSETIERESWADVSYDFTVYVEQELMPFCVENTTWIRCYRYGIPYDEQVKKKDRRKCPDTGCEGTLCVCEPFGQGDFTYGMADESETLRFFKQTNLTHTTK